MVRLETSFGERNTTLNAATRPLLAVTRTGHRKFLIHDARGCVFGAQNRTPSFLPLALQSICHYMDERSAILLSATSLSNS